MRVYQTGHGISVSAIVFNRPASGWMILNQNNLNLPLGVDTLERTINGGRTWTAASVNLISGLSLAGLPPTFGGIHGILLTTMGVFAVLRTDNGGQHWGDLSTTPILEPSIWMGQTIGDRVIWILTPTKLWRSTTGGSHWTVQSTAAFLHPGAKGNDTKNIDFISSRVGWVWSSPRSHPQVWRTIDGGRLWTSWNPVIMSSISVLRSKDPFLSTGPLFRKRL
jgi:hypothetical protein